VEHARDHIIFKLTDPDGSQGFPGEVVSYVYYKVIPYRWQIYINATSSKVTPIMLTSHAYWNLDGFQNPNTNTIMNHNLVLPFSGQRIDVDGILIPTGNIISNQIGTANDFWSKPKNIGDGFRQPGIKGNCGSGCDGYDNCYLVQREQFGAGYFAPLSDGGAWWTDDPVASLRSEWSGIQLNVYSDQAAFQLYSCNGQNGEILTHVSEFSRI
jgi:galactose mutarotase-like enzyme